MYAIKEYKDSALESVSRKGCREKEGKSLSFLCTSSLQQKEMNIKGLMCTCSGSEDAVMLRENGRDAEMEASRDWKTD